MRALHAQFLGAQHDVAVFAAEERQQRAVVALLMPAGRAEQGIDVGGLEIERRQHRRSREQRARARCARRCRRRRQRLRLGQGQRAVDERQVAGLSGGRMISSQLGEESKVDALPRGQRRRHVLDREQGMFVLQAPARQPVDDALRHSAGALREAVHLQCVGGEAATAPQ